MEVGLSSEISVMNYDTMSIGSSFTQVSLVVYVAAS
jgi:hypothetical protein